MSWSRFFRRKHWDQERARELDAYLEIETDENIARGMPPEQARQTARRKLGNSTLVREEIYLMNSIRFFDTVRQDLRYATRTLRRNPGFTLIALMTLALGVGANTAIFSIVNGVLLRPLPFRDPGRLMILDEKWLPRFPHFEATPQHFLDWRELNRSFDQIAAFVETPFNFSSGDRPERIPGVRVSANLPALLGVEPILGRTFRPEEDTAGNDRVVLLGYSLWQRRFGGDPRVIGTTMRLNDIEFTVIGVMPPSFRFPHDAEIWKPMGFTSEDLQRGHFVWAVGRLKPGVTRSQAQAEMDWIMPRLSHPQVWSVNVFPVLDYYVGEIKTPLWILLAAAGCVLLIACVNVGNLLLARGSARQREISTRAALGAGRGRIVQQLLTESLLISLIGGLLGLLLAFGATVALRKFSPTIIPRANEVTVDYGVLLFTLCLSTVTGILFGVSPALRLSRTDFHDSMQAGGRVVGSERRTAFRSTLVASEIALALVLLIGAGLLLKSFWRLLEVRPGFAPERVLTATINLPPTKYKEPYEQTEFVQRLIEHLQTLPGIRQAAVSAGLPFSGASDVGIRFDGRPIGAPDACTTANYYAVTPLYFQAMGIPLINGRLFTAHDTRDSQPVVVINQTMAKRFFPNENPIGERLDISGPTYMREIVGVVGDVKQAGLKAAIPPQVYEPFLQKPSNSFSVVMRGFGNLTHSAEGLRRQVLAIDKDQPISNFRTMEQLVAVSTSNDRFSTSLLGLFAFLALILAAVGIYGVVAYSVSQRTHEIGIRIALGAQQSGILRLVLLQSFRAVLIGVGIGLPASFGLTRLMASLLYGVKTNDPMTFVVVSTILIVTALAASFFPARRAAHVDPMVALRYE